MSQPKPRSTGAEGGCSGCVIFSTDSGERIPPPPFSKAWANFARSSAVEKRPACPATPPIRRAVGSCTSPRSRRHKPGVRHLQRHKNMAGGIFLERLARKPLHQRAQHNKVDVTVGELRTRRILWGLGECHPVSGLLPFPRGF